MERLTKVMSCPDGTKIYDISNKLFGLNTSRADKTRIILEKLAEYEDLEEQGRLVKLPAKDVYSIIDINNLKYAMVMKKPIRELAIYEIEDIDKENCKYFSTEEKAEAKLKELRGGEDGSME